MSPAPLRAFSIGSVIVVPRSLARSQRRHRRLVRDAVTALSRVVRSVTRWAPPRFFAVRSCDDGLFSVALAPRASRRAAVASPLTASCAISRVRAVPTRNPEELRNENRGSRRGLKFRDKLYIFFFYTLSVNIKSRHSIPPFLVRVPLRDYSSTGFTSRIIAPE